MKKIVFEARLLRIDGSSYGTQILVCDAEEEALARASRCARNWSAPIDLYQVPYANQSDEPWQPNQMRFVAHVERDSSPRMAPAALESGQRIALHARAVEALRNLFGGATRPAQRPGASSSVRATP